MLTPRQLNPSLPLELGAAEGEKNSPLLFRVSAFETEPAVCSAISSQLVSLSLKGRIFKPPSNLYPNLMFPFNK